MATSTFFLQFAGAAATACSSSANTKRYLTRPSTSVIRAQSGRHHSLVDEFSAPDTVCGDEGGLMRSISRRHGLAAAGFLSLGAALPAVAAILEADDDLELLEKVKQDRKKRIERQSIINSSNKETGYVQEVVYKLSKVGQAIEKNDLSAASSVLGSSSGASWVQNVNAAFKKLTSSSEEKVVVEEFNSSLASLISSVGKSDVESSKLAFVSSAGALEKWISLVGLGASLKGL